MEPATGTMSGELGFNADSDSSSPLRLYAAKPNPLDRSRFTIDYERSEGRGTIEGHLRADDTVDLKILSGPAKPSR
jgi:hypothetical protein